ncbi:MAG TPA: hypothetical protein VFI29_07215 [Hanamia sp.]|nr:hypothetical protein [Hanamia sp.]
MMGQHVPDSTQNVNYNIKRIFVYDINECKKQSPDKFYAEYFFLDDDKVGNVLQLHDLNIENALINATVKDFVTGNEECSVQIGLLPKPDRDALIIMDSKKENNLRFEVKEIIKNDDGILTLICKKPDINEEPASIISPFFPFF